MTFPRLVALFLATLGLANIALATEETYVREYIYQASEADSKLSARTIALQEVKRLLLAELGTHVSSLVKIQASSDGKQLGTQEIETLSAGVTRVEILEEKWNGVEYVLKAQIKADPAEVLKSLQKMLDVDKKAKQVSQLDSELGKIRDEKIQIAESLTQSKKEITAALVEIARLKKQLEIKQTEATKQTLQTAYQKQVNQLTLEELLKSGWDYYSQGNLKEAFSSWKIAAEQGLVQAQLLLGSMYYNGEGVPRDLKQVAYWSLKAAEQGNAKAQGRLGSMYYNGAGVPRDFKQAAYWFQKAAEQDLIDAQIALVYLLDSGNGRDVKQAVYWMQKAAAQGDVDMQFELGLHYFKGDGVSRDAKQAAYWFRKAAEQGHALAQYFLGSLYDFGDGVAHDPKLARSWYQKAAEQGEERANIALRSMK